MELNSLYQLYAIKREAPWVLEAARRLLFMPDLFNYFLTGEMRAERTISSTSQFYDPAGKQFAAGLLRKLGIPSGLPADLVEPGTLPGGRDAGVHDGQPRYSRGRGGGSGGGGFAVVLHQLGHVVADGNGTSPPADRRRVARGQLHQRGRGGRDHTVPEEHSGAVVAAGVPAGVGAGGKAIRLRGVNGVGRGSAAR